MLPPEQKIKLKIKSLFVHRIMSELGLVGFPIGERAQTHARSRRAHARCGKTKEHRNLKILFY